MRPPHPLRHLPALSLALLAASAAFGQTTVANAWVRGTVDQQKATGLFAQITSAGGGRLVSVSSPVAGIAEIHEMAMDGEMMRMRAVTALDLPAGRTVELKRTLKAGDVVPLTLVIEGADKKRETVEVRAPVRALGDAMK